ncbi:uncharacterized protein BP01DRAFT_425168 [Aspergillus saccharolyticus JOP 1030-1]|uniref:Uncharacterized protein n=1 Tax=Aspergillus saccharolyticus JOP 1030-1 TaxID=1450539 RepID=A0A318Z9T5_9EURO|nr:hypothetical protein BP01DRAFT_425168 [Aspergillus saccharolyticus JOP 1030-1]PYH43187.1 hypothetical protein BP01DRAFT_425168 [Aspergillus saccharolyticus JOP 1030-1]
MSGIHASPVGYSLRRNGSCFATETDCGITWFFYHACCPKGTTCASDVSVNCCCPEAKSLRIHDGCLRKRRFAWIEYGYVSCTDDVSALAAEVSLVPSLSPAQSSPGASRCSSTITTSGRNCHVTDAYDDIRLNHIVIWISEYIHTNICSKY